MGEMITDVGIDLDGVIYPFANAFRSYCEDRMEILNLPEPTHWNFYEDWGLDEETFTAWLTDAARYYQVFSTHMPYAGVEEAWKELRDMGVRIHILTARPQSAWAQTAVWLTRYNLHVDTLHFGPSKSFLANLAKGKAILLDDHIAYYEEAERAGIVPCLMTRAWNESKENANRVTNLTEFVSFIRGYNARRTDVVSTPLTFTPKGQFIKTDPYKKTENPYRMSVKKPSNPHQNPPTRIVYQEPWHITQPEQNS